MAAFRKKPVEVEAVRFTGSSTSEAAIRRWINGLDYTEPTVHTRDLKSMFILTMEGTMEARPGDWIIKGVAGEFYPCKPDIFEATYEPVED